jgi:hypothetical protein
MSIFPFLLCIVSKGANEWKHVCLDFSLPKHK